MSYIRYPAPGVSRYSTFSAFPPTSSNGDLALALDTDVLYAYNTTSMMWVAIGGGSSVLSIGPIDSASPSANGAVISTNNLIMQSASATVPGLVNTGVQSFAGNKTFIGSISASNFSGSSSGTNTGDVTIGTANGLSIAGQVLSLALSSTSTTGALSSTDWNTFNNKIGSISIGALDAQPANANGLAFASGVLSSQSADATHPGMINNTTQQISGSKIFRDAAAILGGSDTVQLTIAANAIQTSSIFQVSDSSSATILDLANSGNLTISGNLLAANFSGSSSGINTGNVTIGAANGLSIVGQALSLALSSASTTGALSLTDWNTFNNKQAAFSGLSTNSLIYATSATTVASSTASKLNWDDTNGRMSIGAALGTAATLTLNVTSGSDLPLNVFSKGTNNAVQIQNQSSYTLALVNAAASALAGSTIGGAFSRGTLSARTQSLAGDQLFSLSAQGYTGSAFGPGLSGAISFVAAENTTATANGGLIAFSTTPNTTLVPVSRMTIGQSGLVNISGLTASLPIQTNASKDLVSLAIDLSTAQATGILAAGRFPALTGDVTTSSGSLATTIANLAVTNAKIANTTIDLTTKVTGTLPIANGGTGQVAANAAFNALSPLTTKGDIVGFSTVNARIPVGTDGFALVADSTQALGVKYAAVLSNPMTTAGDIIYENATPAPARLPIGSANQRLTTISGLPAWTAPVIVSAYNQTVTGTITGTDSIAVFTATNIDNTSSYNTGTGTFTAPKTSVFCISASIAATGTFIAADFTQISVYINGAIVSAGIVNVTAASGVTYVDVNDVIVSLTSGDTVRIEVSSSGTSPVYVTGGNKVFNKLSIKEVI